MLRSRVLERAFLAPRRRVSQRAGDTPVFYGWVVAAISACAMFASGPGQTFTISTFVDPMRTDLGLSRTAISGAYSLGGLVASLVLIVLGRTIDRLGGRLVLLGSAAFLGLACLAMGQVHSLVGLIAGFIALRLLGPGALTLGAYTLTAQWFVRRWGTALGFMTFGVAVSQLILPVTAQHIIVSLNWRSAWVVLAGTVWVLVLPLTALLVWDRPDHLGLRPDGQGASQQPDVEHEVDALAPSEALNWAARTPSFWLLLLAGAVPALISTGLTFHQVAYLNDQGLSAQIPLVLVLFGLANAASMTLVGPLLDRVDARTVLVVLLLLLSGAAALLLGVGGARSWIVFLYAPILGTAVGGLGTTGGVMWASYYGRRHLGRFRSIDGAIKMVAAAAGPLPLALARDQIGSYAPALVGFALLAALTSVAGLQCRPPRRVVAR